MRLAPGLRVVRRGLDRLQVGLHPGRRAVLPRDEVSERALDQLLNRLPPDEDPAVRSTLARLERHGCLAPAGPVGAPPTSVAVLARPEVPGVSLAGDLLEASAVSQTSSWHAADVVIVLCAGEIDRDQLDPLVRRGSTHLLVRLVDGGALLGPFVVPGRTPCLRCIDAQESVRDPDHVAVTTRYVHATARPRADGLPDHDPVLAALAVSWAVRDTVAHLQGREPSTWSRTVFLGPAPTDRHESAWRRSPRCGCVWQADDRSSGTM